MTMPNPLDRLRLIRPAGHVKATSVSARIRALLHRPKAAAPVYEGATETSPLPKVEVAAAGEDPMLVKQIEIHHEVASEAAAIEAAKVEEAAEVLELRAQLDAIFAPYARGVEHVFQRLFGRMETRWGLPVGTCHAAYLDVVRSAAEAENFARDVVTEDLYPTVEFDVDEFNRWRARVAEAVLVS